MYITHIYYRFMATIVNWKYATLLQNRKTDVFIYRIQQMYEKYVKYY